MHAKDGQKKKKKKKKNKNWIFVLTGGEKKLLIKTKTIIKKNTELELRLT